MDIYKHIKSDNNNNNHSSFGITLQKTICDRYYVPTSEYARSLFESSCNSSYQKICNDIVDAIFKEIKEKPITCLTNTISTKEKETLSPHNFILLDGSTLSIRTNIKGAKVCPRVVGQCGFKVFNDFFSDIAGFEIKDQEDIKNVIFNNIHLMLPTFIEYLQPSDYNVWVQLIDNKYNLTIFKNNSIYDLSYDRSDFSFTRDLDSWTESTTLKYKGISIAEIQVHKNRAFKFRFSLDNFLKFIKVNSDNTETFGISAEVGICNLFSIPIPSSYKGRYSQNVVSDIMPVLKSAFATIPKVTDSTGSTKGARGKQSKCSYDFILEGNKTLSLKTNIGKLVCPPEVGQPGASTCYEYFKDFTTEDHIDRTIFKEMVFENFDKMIPIYLEHLFDSDYLLRICKNNTLYSYQIYEKNYGVGFKWDKSKFEFTRKNVDEWNESNTIKYDGIDLGQFQVHNNRNCFKFRFYIDNLKTIFGK